MKKRYLFSFATLIGAGLIYQNKRSKSDHFEKIARTKIAVGPNTHLDGTIKDAGMPDQIDIKDEAQLENSKMVAEGSQFGVQYYNNLKEKEGKLKSQKN